MTQVDQKEFLAMFAINTLYARKGDDFMEQLAIQAANACACDKFTLEQLKHLHVMVKGALTRIS